MIGKRETHVKIMAKLEQERRELLAAEKTANVEELEETKKERELQFLHLSVQKIPTDDVNCADPECRCKAFDVPLSSIRARPPAPLNEILTHKFHHDKIFFYCKLDSLKAGPEYRLACQVDKSLRRAYRDKLLELERVPRQEEVWTMDDEFALRYALHDPMNAKQSLIQKQVEKCADTVHWESQTKNGRELDKIPRDSKNEATAPGPVVFNVHGQPLYDVERIIGATVNMGKMWFLIKWLGYESKDNSWEPKTALAGKSELVDEFYRIYGKPSQERPKILSPEGEIHDAWVTKLDACANADVVVTSLPQSRASGESQTSNLNIPTSGASSGKKRKSQGVDQGKKNLKKDPPTYEVERIIGALLENEKMEFLVKWKGYTLEESTWEPEASMVQAEQAIADFFDTFGTPTTTTRKVLDKDGKKYEKFMIEK